MVAGVERGLKAVRPPARISSSKMPRAPTRQLVAGEKPVGVDRLLVTGARQAATRNQSEVAALKRLAAWFLTAIKPGFTQKGLSYLPVREPRQSSPSLPLLAREYAVTVDMDTNFKRRCDD